MEKILIIVGAVIVGAAVFFVVWRAKGRSGSSGAGTGVASTTAAQTAPASPAEDRVEAEREAAERAAAERAAAERAAAERAAAERAAIERAVAERAAAERAAAERVAAERAAAAEAERREALQRASAEAASQVSPQIPAPREVRTLDPAGPKPLPPRYRRTPEQEPMLAPRGNALPRRVANQVPQEAIDSPVKPVPTGEARGRIGDFRPRGR